MEDFFGVLFMLALLGAVVAVVYAKHREFREFRTKGVPKSMVLSDNCTVAPRQITGFLHARLQDTGTDVKTDKEYLDLQDSPDIVDLVRLVHLAGCRMTITQASGQPLAGAGKRFFTELSAARKARIDGKYRRR